MAAPTASATSAWNGRVSPKPARPTSAVQADGRSAGSHGEWVEAQTSTPSGRSAAKAPATASGSVGSTGTAVKRAVRPETAARTDET
ncbi:hypothetical protein Pflav_042020 [Phytohabitans flavus]|uniref:Uncharacterized protein n=1 Tax=Phytohabitans flavus TaxID=1076124 RepID=A0A6F8XVA5_9ACTN|nr:hypothetical protein [Phytohabitans flavus]BCB77792.1 hypothetical protein Pflav_042020 [Phytohabitans flavus]